MVSMRRIRIRIFSLRRAFRKHPVASIFTLLLGLWFTSGIIFPRAPRRPKWADRAVTPAQRADVVKHMFKFAWKGYYNHAFPNDELVPLWNWYSNSRNGWGATAVEALGTAIIMDSPEIVDQILNFIPTIDYSKSKGPIDVFETTIRYLGGMLSAYEMLTGPMHHLARNKPENVDSLLNQSITLANVLKPAFNTRTGIPRKALPTTMDINTASSIGTLLLEWTRLSDITGDKQYAALVDKGMRYLLHPGPKVTEPYPGIVGTWVNVDSGFFTDAWGTWGGGGDSFYEYLIKMYIYDQSRFGPNKDRWIKAIDSSMKFIAQTPLGGDLTFLTHTTGNNFDHESGHLQCFAGGNIILGGTVLNITRYVDFGLKLTDTCHEMYTRTITGIGPETINWPPAENMNPEREKEFKTLGFGITNANFDLRPETVESYYYAYRVTKDPKYQDWAWEALVAIVAHTKTRNGFSPISNVNKVGGGWRRGKQESFLFSELFKYLYLIFAEDSEIQVNHDGRNKWVFNTEGHPLRVFGTPI